MVFLAQVAVLSSSQIQGIREAASLSGIDVTKSLQSHSTKNLTIDIRAPVLVIPIRPTMSDGALVINYSVINCIDMFSFVRSLMVFFMKVMQLGRFQVMSQNQSKQTINIVSHRLSQLSVADLQQLDEKTRSMCYDRLDIKISDISCFFSMGRTNSHLDFLVEKVSIAIELDQCVAPTVPWLHNVIVSGKMAEVKADLSTTKFHRLLQIAEAFEVLRSTTTSGESSHVAALAGSLEAKNSATITCSNLAQTEPSPEDIIDPTALARVLGSQQEAKQLLSQLDANGDNQVTWREYHDWKKCMKERLKHNLLSRVQISMSKFTLSLTNDTDSTRPSESVLEFDVSNFDCFLEMRAFDKKVSITLESIKIQDMLSPFANQGDDFKYLMYTTGAKTSTATDAINSRAFIRINLLTLDQESPDFLDSPVKLNANIEIGSIVFCVEPASIEGLGKFVLLDFLPTKPQPRTGPSGDHKDSRPKKAIPAANKSAHR